ncbi:MAG: hypothetical protein HC812_17345 [Leptolyngbya sp. RL_3_1]|nr:hypothetical protein [Leptolyngbya sp. RL_3_1]
MGSGVYEELNPVGQMRDLFTSAVAGEVVPFTTVGDFAAGTARRLVFSPSVDHAAAPYDPVLQREIIAWAEQSFGLPTTDQPLRTQRQLLGQVLAVGSAVGWAIALYKALLPSLWVRASLGFACLVLLGLPVAWGAGVSLAGVMTLLVGDYGDRLSPAQKSPVLRLLLYGGLLSGLGLLAITANAALTGSLGLMPRAILGLPMLAKTLVVGLLYDRFHMVRYGLASPVGIGLVVSLVAIEGSKPGWVLMHLGYLTNRIINAIRQPIQCQPPASRSLLLLLVLLMVLLGLLWQHRQSGLLSWEAGRFALRLLGMFLVLPGLIAIGVIRSPVFQRWENRLRSP